MQCAVNPWTEQHQYVHSSSRICSHRACVPLPFHIDSYQPPTALMPINALMQHITILTMCERQSMSPKARRVGCRRG